MNLEDKQQLLSLFQKKILILSLILAAQERVRYSIENPDVYIQSNMLGFHIYQRLPAILSSICPRSSTPVYGTNAQYLFRR
jgi:UDP-glucuronate 4-epimerase